MSNWSPGHFKERRTTHQRVRTVVVAAVGYLLQIIFIELYRGANPTGRQLVGWTDRLLHNDGVVVVPASLIQ